MHAAVLNRNTTRIKNHNRSGDGTAQRQLARAAYSESASASTTLASSVVLSTARAEFFTVVVA